MGGKRRRRKERRRNRFFGVGAHTRKIGRLAPVVSRPKAQRRCPRRWRKDKKAAGKRNKKTTSPGKRLDIVHRISVRRQTIIVCGHDGPGQNAFPCRDLPDIGLLGTSEFADRRGEYHAGRFRRSIYAGNVRNGPTSDARRCVRNNTKTIRPARFTLL